MALPTPPTEFAYFQHLPLEMQCKIWQDHMHPIAPRILPANVHSSPNGTRTTSGDGVRDMMTICRSAWFAYRLYYKGVRLALDPFGSMINVYPKPQTPDSTAIMRFNETTDVLSQQYHLHVLTSGRGTHTDPAQNERQATVHSVACTIISGGPIAGLPNMLRHICIDLLSCVGTTPYQPPSPSANAVSLASFLDRLLCGPDTERANLRTITITVADSDGSRKMFRLVATKRLFQATAKPLAFGRQTVGRCARSIRNMMRSGHGAIFCRPPSEALVNQEFAFLGVTRPYAQVRNNLHALGGEVVTWQLALGVGSVNYARKKNDTASTRLRKAIIEEGPLDVDGICAPNYAMGEARVF